MSTDISDIRSQVVMLNSELRTLSHLAASGSLTIRDFTLLVRMLTGGNPKVQAATSALYTYISVVQAAQTATKLLHISMGPVGWALLGISTGAAVFGGAYVMSMNEAAQMG